MWVGDWEERARPRCRATCGSSLASSQQPRHAASREQQSVRQQRSQSRGVGEEREAAFAGRGEVRQAYQKVAVQQRRDPVLVTTSGPDRVLMQCFPIPPKGGTMKIRIGVTVPLGIESTNRAALSLPSFVERNFRVSPHFEHSVWLESSQSVSGGSKKLNWISATNGKPGIRGQLTEANLTSTDGILWFDSPIGANVVRAVDRKGREPVLISQTVAPMAAQLPSRIAIVLDGSVGMNEFFPKIARALDGVPGEPELSIWLAQDGLQNIYNSSWQSREPASSAVARLKGFGGHDNVAGLLQAWEWTAARSNGVVVWIHGAQPVLLNGIESLKQRLDWRGAGDGPVEPMRDAEVDARGFGIFLLDVLLDHRLQRRHARRRLREQRRGLVDGDQVVVFVEDGEHEINHGLPFRARSRLVKLA